MNCSECRELLSDVLANEAPSADVDAVEAHLGECGECRALAGEMSRQDRLLCEALAAAPVALLATRIAEQLEAPSRPRGRRRWRWALGGLAASILVIAALVAFGRRTGHDDGTAAVADTSGNVVFTNEAQGSGRLEVGQGIRTVGPESSAVLAFRDTSRLVLGEDTSVRLERLEGGPEAELAPAKRVFLEKGTVTAEVTEQPADRPMVIATAAAEMLVVGTRFRVHVSAESTSLEVEAGVVRFRDRNTDRVTDVHAGEKAVAGDIRTAVVGGEVRFQGAAIPQGIITFLREDGRVASSVIDKGIYKIYKAPVGPVVVTVQVRGGAPAGFPARYQDPKASELRYRVEPNEQTHVLDLQP
ncbi:hypothetical protein AYO40_06140 [Planctomycetaceae bacterium SCGC AG-212-D15]|nr:hypothetical protein AYO40_06140 [Planctomycetaceae bacterium SCGC AG-212-D15]